MKQVRRFATRGVFVPLALFTLIVASSVPASAATTTLTAKPSAPAAPSLNIKLKPQSISW